MKHVEPLKMCSNGNATTRGESGGVTQTPSNARPLTVWEHSCCGTAYWSAAPRCDRCGTVAHVRIVGVSIDQAMAHDAECHDQATPARVVDFRPDAGRALVGGLCLLAALITTLMIVGAIVELERANYVAGILCTLAGAAAPAAAVVFAIDRVATRRRLSMLNGVNAH